jgi:hypothetical protein
MTDFTQGNRVQTTVGEKGIVVAVNKAGCKVGFDNPLLGYGVIEPDILMSIEPSPAISTLPQEQRDILQALHEKRTTEGQHEAHQALVEYGYITAEHKLTPYGRYVTNEWVKAGMPVEEAQPVAEAQESILEDKQPKFKKGDRVVDAFEVAPRHGEVVYVYGNTMSYAVLWDGQKQLGYGTIPEYDLRAEVAEAQESTTPTPEPTPVVEARIVELPDALGAADLARNQEFEKLKAELSRVTRWHKENSELADRLQKINAELEAAKAELEIEVERLRSANALLSDAVKIKNDEIRLANEQNKRQEKTIERQQQELEDVKTKRLSLKPVGNVPEQFISQSEPMSHNGVMGVFRQTFLPSLEQPKAAIPEMVIPAESIPETAEEELDRMDQELLIAAGTFITEQRKQRKMKYAS